MPAPANLVHQTTTGTGTGNLTLSAVNGKRSFNTAFGNGSTTNVFDYFISSQGAAEWERGTGHMSDATTLVRDTVIESSNANAAVNFSAGTKDVVNDVPALSQARLDGTAAFTTTQTFNGLISAVGGQVGFPATQVASSDPNTLDDYKEGSATIALAFGGASTGITYNNQSLRYVKMGQLVYFRIDLNLSSKGSATGAAAITGLPYTSHGTVIAAGISMWVQNMATQTTWVGLIDISTTSLLPYYIATGSHTQAQNTDFTNTSRLLISGCYQAST